MTEYSCLTTEDLIHYALQRDNRTPMEEELAERLEILLNILEMEEEDDARGQDQSGY